MEYHMLYVKCRKSFEVRRQKKFITLPCAKIKHTAKLSQKSKLCRVLLILPCVFLSTLGKIYVCRVPVNLHSANLGAYCKNEVSGSAS